MDTLGTYLLEQVAHNWYDNGKLRFSDVKRQYSVHIATENRHDNGEFMIPMISLYIHYCRKERIRIIEEF